MLKIKAIDLLKLYRQTLLSKHLKVELRVNNYVQKIVVYWNLDELEKEDLLELYVDDWFIGSSCTDGDIVINLVEKVEDSNG